MSAILVRAQFTISENDRASLRWDSISSKNFRVIYPRGCDSIAVDYLKAQEYYRPKVATDIGMVSGQFQKRPLDVILHTENAASNGMVSWAPSRMEMYTLPTWRNLTGMTWIDNLAVHEGRHAAQMQMGYRRFWRPMPYILGQMAAGAVNAYPGTLLMEGDAVVAETALTGGGRGRNADFLDRYIYSWDNGDYRNYAKWRFGSIYKPTPNNYALGYAMISGARTVFDSPYFMADYLDYIGRRPYDPWPLRHALRRASGMKFKENFAAVMGAHYDAWAADTLARGPFVKAEQISAPVRYIRDYSNPVLFSDGRILWIKSDIYHNPSLVSIASDGSEERLLSMPSAMELNEADSCLYWVELRRDKRWGQVIKSVIRKYDPSSGKVRTFRSDGNYSSASGYVPGKVIAMRQNGDGSSEIVVMDAVTARDERIISLGRNIETGGITAENGVIYLIGTTAEGMGIWKYDENGLQVLLKPQHVNISNINGRNGGVTFMCDRSGVNEFYRYDLSRACLYQLTSTKYGGKDFCENGDGGVSFAQYEGRGTAVKQVKAEDVLNREVDWNSHYHYPIADKLSEQEDTMTFDQRLRHPKKNLDLTPDYDISPVKRYRKFPNGFRIHSWAPLSVDIDAVDQISVTDVTRMASLGATLWMQNSSSTFDATLRYKAAPVNGEWFHSGHIKLAYKGLYPVFELSADVNDRKAEHYDSYPDIDPDGNKVTKWKIYDKGAYVSASLRSYVPLGWSGGVWRFGVVPQVGIYYSNDTVDGVHCLVFKAAVTSYAMTSTPQAAVYPRYGAGLQLVWSDPHMSAYLYGYLPGICCGQGLRLSALGQLKTPLQTNRFFMGSPSSLMPRGLSGVGSAATYACGVKLTADYAIPFPVGDWNIGSAFMCRRGIVTPHFDYGFIQGDAALQTPRPDGWLYSAGSSVALEFGSFFWVKTPVTIGLTYSYSGGSLMPYFTSQLSGTHHFGFIFNIEIPS